MVRPESSRQRPRRLGPIVAAVAASLATGLIASRPAEACGPWFPTTLLDQRSAVLLGLPEGSFDFEAQHLLSPPQPNFKAIESDYYGDLEADRKKFAAEGLTAGQVATMEAAQGAADGRAAYAAGEGLPEDLRLYVAGAVDFHHQDKASAEQRFAAVAALPEAERKLRGVWAEFMLGRVIADAAESAKHYARVRELVAAGAPDPAGLAVASLGQEARDKISTDFAGAVRLYAEQASYQSRSGTNSLLMLARNAFAAPAELDAKLKDALTRRLLVAYALSRPSELNLAASGKSRDDWDAVVAAQNETAAPAASVALLKAIDALKLDEVEGADRLAALAYRNGNYEAASAWAAKSDAPLSQWVRAKLALRKGDDAAARAALAAAAKSFPADEQWAEGLGQDFAGYESVQPQCRAQAELGVLALGRGDYTLALSELYKARRIYWSDLAYVAERVVTVDELKTFVDAEVKPTTPATAAATPESEAYGQPRDAAAGLRHLLARRLLRAGRYDDAVAYFDDPALKAKAVEYGRALRSTARWDRIAIARDRYTAAMLARTSGMELLGFEGDPDYGIFGGDFDLNSAGWSDNGEPVGPRKDLTASGDFTTDGERQRLAASHADPLSRWHYRMVATRQAEAAADLLPRRSQAYAAVLCKASGWVIDREPERGQELYRRYVKHGAIVPGMLFARTCPEPDWAGAQKQLDQQRWRYAKYWLRRVGPGFIVLGLGMLIWHLAGRRGSTSRARRNGSKQL